MQLLLPLFTPFFTALLCLLWWNRPRAQGWITVAGMATMLVCAMQMLFHVKAQGIIALQAGNWAAPFGITLAADLLSSLLVALAAFMGLLTGFYSLAAMDDGRKAHGFYPLFNFMIFGVAGAFLTGDIFNLYVWFEIMLISSFVLLALGGLKTQLEGAIKYVALNLLSSAIFLAGTGLIYSLTGTLNFADLALKMAALENKGMVSLASMFFLVAFGIKAALFPLFFWMPASYHTPPIAVSAVFAALLTKVGVYAMLRTFTLVFPWDAGFTHHILTTASALTMSVGVLGAAAQYDFRRVLAFHSVSQVGYMVMGLALFSPLALAGSIFFMIHHSMVKSNLFLISGIVRHLKGSFHLKYVGGVYRDYPWLAFLFFVPGLSLAGLPPFSGFWAKFMLVKAGIEGESFWLVFTALAVSLLTLYSMTKIWNEVFWTDEPELFNDPEHYIESPGPLWMMAAPVVVLVGCTILIGVFAAPFFNIAMEAAEQLLNRDAYIQTILNPAQ